MSLARISLRDLEYLLAVVELGHFGRAAERCAVSQPALSAQIKKLEASLGQVLLERSRQGVRPVASAAPIIEQARRVVAEARRLLEVARGASGELGGELKLWAIATLGPYLFPHILRPIREAFPKVELILGDGLTERIVQDLLRGELDLALLSLPLAAEGLELRPLFFEPFVAMHPSAAPALARPLTMDKLATPDLLLLEEGHCLREQTMSLCHLAAPSRRYAGSLETLRHLVAAGAGHSILPALAAAGQPSLGGLVAYTPIDDPRAGREIALAWRASDPRSAEFERLAELIGRHCPPITAAGDIGASREADPAPA